MTAWRTLTFSPIKQGGIIVAFSIVAEAAISCSWSFLILEYTLVGVYGSVFVTAVQPLFYLVAVKSQAFVLHIFHCRRQLILSFFRNIVIQQVLHFRTQVLAVFKIVDPDDRQVGNKSIRFFPRRQ